MSDMPSFGTPPPAPPAPRAEETPSAQAELTKSNEVGLSWLKEIEGELAAEAAKDPIIIRVPDMPNRTGWGLIVDPNVDHREFKQWLRNAGENEKKQRDADNTLFCIEIIKNKTTGFMKDGRRLTHNGDEDGDDMNFADPIMSRCSA